MVIHDDAPTFALFVFKLLVHICVMVNVFLGKGLGSSIQRLGYIFVSIF